jgi:SMI1 / KNR4 family (SUKH-1)
MATFPWRELLTQWSHDILKSKLAQKKGYLITPEALASGWLGYPGASEAQIRQAEQRLGTTFPPSYRTFLQVSNGWTVLTAFTGTLWSTEQVDWLHVQHPELITILTEDGERDIPDAEYFVYDERQQRDGLRTRYLASLLALSDYTYLDGDMYLLNPQVRTTDAEWEAWSFVPGDCSRYRSFWELMQAEYELFRIVTLR